MAMNNLAASIAFLVILSGCVSVEQQRINLENDIAKVYSTDYSKEIEQFFVEEAVTAGVKTIRAMKPSEKPPKSNKNEIVGCAYALPLLN
jgi:hypothetical protein